VKLNSIQLTLYCDLNVSYLSHIFWYSFRSFWYCSLDSSLELRSSDSSAPLTSDDDEEDDELQLSIINRLLNRFYHKCLMFLDRTYSLHLIIV